MNLQPDIALADRMERIAKLTSSRGGVEHRSLLVIVQRWDAAALLAALRRFLQSLAPEQAAGWCARLTRTLVLTGPASACLKGESPVHVEGVVGLCLARDGQLDDFVRRLPPFKGRSALAGLDGLSLPGESFARRTLWLDASDGDLARTVVDLCHVLAESVFVMGDPLLVPLQIRTACPFPQVLPGACPVYVRAVPHAPHSERLTVRAVLLSLEGERDATDPRSAGSNNSTKRDDDHD